MSTAAAKANKVCDYKTRHLVCGFVRSVEHGLNQIIPVNIIHICLSYYLIIEGWLECGNKYISISEDGQTITNKGAGSTPYDTAYGKFEIDCDQEMKGVNDKYNVFEWTFFIHNDAWTCVSIGIDEISRKWINERVDSEKGTIHYSLNSDSALYTPDSGAKVKRNKRYRTDDTIIMQLNVKRKTLIFYKQESNNNEEICRVSNIKTDGMKYCIASYLWNTGCIEIKEFNIKSV